MKRYVQLQGLQLNDQQYPMKAYVAAPDNAIKGILYNAVYNQSQEEIFEDLVALNPSRTFTIADARQLGRTKSILVTFINTTEVPRQLNFYGAVYSCHPFKAKVEACFNCRKPGHRADVCPKERTGLCPRCGIAHPVKPTPDCTPKCILCGGAHFTGTRRCKVRFDRSGNSSNNTAKSTTRTTPPASPPPVSPPESSRNSRSHHRSPSRSRSRSRTSSRQGRHRSRSVSFPPLPGQKDQNIEKQRPALTSSGVPKPRTKRAKKKKERLASLDARTRARTERRGRLPGRERKKEGGKNDEILCAAARHGGRFKHADDEPRTADDQDDLSRRPDGRYRIVVVCRPLLADDTSVVGEEGGHSIGGQSEHHRPPEPTTSGSLRGRREFPSATATTSPMSSMIFLREIFNRRSLSLIVHPDEGPNPDSAGPDGASRDLTSAIRLVPRLFREPRGRITPSRFSHPDSGRVELRT
ncbi:hypothetical protein HPB49_015849 [Dermacentor silvarum]|uniref:Uncharacterized protein n=1 Tax=Dermacentor silvarum TaxID=543639 RepID=A0ACB8C4D4_DERSI|nr:hypothetical protein HPB49_015849 [Dermacentor silvarum]